MIGKLRSTEKLVIMANAGALAMMWSGLVTPAPSSILFHVEEAQNVLAGEPSEKDTATSCHSLVASTRCKVMLLSTVVLASMQMTTGWFPRDEACSKSEVINNSF